MKPAWDKLMKEYKGHASALVADVDCTAAGKPLVTLMEYEDSLPSNTEILVPLKIIKEDVTLTPSKSLQMRT